MAFEDANTKSLLHFDGADGSTTFIDQFGKTWTANGNAQIDTAQSVFGGASAFFDGASWIDTPDIDDFDVGSGDFTIDFWFKRNSLGVAGVFKQNQTPINCSCYFDEDDYLIVVLRDNSTYYNTYSNISVTDTNWHHFAIVRLNGLKIYIDGTEVGNNSLPGITFSSSANDFCIGKTFPSNHFNGWIDEFRFSKGVARWTENFTPPNTQYYVNYEKSLSAGCDANTGSFKSSGKSLFASVRSTANIAKSTLKNILVNIGAAAWVFKSVNKNISAYAKISALSMKSVAKTLSAAAKILLRVLRYWPVFPSLNYTEYFVSLEVIGVPTAGSTITLKGIFPDSAGNLTCLEDVTCKVYGPSRVLLATLTPSEVSTGVYSTEYTIPEDKFGQFDYEFSGILGERTIVGRSSFDSIWK